MLTMSFKMTGEKKINEKLELESMCYYSDNRNNDDNDSKTVTIIIIIIM